MRGLTIFLPGVAKGWPNNVVAVLKIGESVIILLFPFPPFLLMKKGCKIEMADGGVAACVPGVLREGSRVHKW